VKSCEWYTPAKIIDAAGLAMGGIDLDPASCAEANKVVGAKEYLTKEQDGLSRPWWGNVWLNPPFTGKLCSTFVRKAVQEYADRKISQACVLFPVSMHTKWVPEVLEKFNAFCWIVERVHFWGGRRTSAFPYSILGLQLDPYAAVTTG
jgi:ParB family chromosome partitioning protein